MFRNIKQKWEKRKESNGVSGGGGGDSDSGPLQASTSFSQSGNVASASSSSFSSITNYNNPSSVTPTSPTNSFSQRLRLKSSSVSSATTTGNCANNAEALAEKQILIDTTMLSQNVEHLSRFDACVEACDAQAASSTFAHTTNRRDPVTNLYDCSVLVSPDGDLLLLPQEQQQQQQQTYNKTLNNNNASETIAQSSSLNGENMEDLSRHSQASSNTSELGDEYTSAIRIGNDWAINGEKIMNGFTCNGWSIPAVSLALRQTEQLLHDFADFCEEIVLSKKESAARSSVACDKLKSVTIDRTPFLPPDLKQDMELLEPMAVTKDRFDVNIRNRVGPMLYPGGTIQSCIIALEEYCKYTYKKLS